MSKDRKAVDPSGPKGDDPFVAQNLPFAPVKARVDTHNSIPTKDWHHFPQPTRYKTPQSSSFAPSASISSSATTKMHHKHGTVTSDETMSSSSQAVHGSLQTRTSIRGKGAIKSSHGMATANTNAKALRGPPTRNAADRESYAETSMTDQTRTTTTIDSATKLRSLQTGDSNLKSADRSIGGDIEGFRLGVDQRILQVLGRQGYRQNSRPLTPTKDLYAIVLPYHFRGLTTFLA
jgi:hypothetical protein